jgi:CheY-like chemotaxis protein
MTMVGNIDVTSLLSGARILVVEDEWMVQLLLKELLNEYGCEIVGPANRVAKANKLASVEALDGALLDLNVAGETVYAVAKTLSDRDIPFVFVTGYAAEWISESYRKFPALQKPIHSDKLKQLLGAMLSHRKH